MSMYRKEVIVPGDAASKLAHHVCMKSYGNCSAVKIIPRQPGNFRGAVDFSWRREVLSRMLDDGLHQTMQNDGAGGKPQFFTLVGTESVFRGLGWEIITMCADDIVRSGGFPAIMINDLNVKRITDANFPLVKALFQGYGRALKQARLVNLTGEIAVMKHSITAFCDHLKGEQLIVTWGGACLGLSQGDRIIDGSRVKHGMPIVGLNEKGYRCNGGTFFTNLLLLSFDEKIPEILPAEFQSFVKKLTVPSVSYAKTVSRVHGWQPDGGIGIALAKMVGVYHITGGGIWGKFAKALPVGAGAHLSFMPDPPKVLLQAQKMSWRYSDLKLDDWHAYETFHGGCGMLIICETNDDAKRLVGEARKDGIGASIVGMTTKSRDGEVKINSCFAEDRILSSLENEIS